MHPCAAVLPLRNNRQHAKVSLLMRLLALKPPTSLLDVRDDTGDFSPNRHSLLYRQKFNSGSYRGTRWNNLSEVWQWCDQLQTGPSEIRHAYGIFLPSGGILARAIEQGLPSALPWGGFLAVAGHKSLSSAAHV